MHTVYKRVELMVLSKTANVLHAYTPKLPVVFFCKEIQSLVLIYGIMRLRAIHFL